MAYLKDKGYEARAFYLNALYVLFILLGSLFAATLNGEHHVDVPANTGNGKDFSLPLYQACALSPVTGDGDEAKDLVKDYTDQLKVRADAAAAKEKADEDEPDRVCLAFVGLPTTEDGDFDIHPQQKDAFDRQQTLFNVAVATAVVNALLFGWSVLMHWKGFGISYHFMLEPVFSIVNLCLFAGLVGNLGGIEDLNMELNVDNNVLFENINVFAVAVAGLVIAALDLAGSNLVIYWACKSYKCWSE